MHIYGIQKNGNDEPICRAAVEMQLKEQTCGHSRGRRGWNELRKQHWHAYTTEKGATEAETGGGHHRPDGRESEQAPGAGGGQGGLACCSPWGRKELDTTE